MIAGVGEEGKEAGRKEEEEEQQQQKRQCNNNLHSMIMFKFRNVVYMYTLMCKFLVFYFK